VDLKYYLQMDNIE